MKQQLIGFWGNEDGQDLVEYTFLVTLVALGAIGLLKTQGASVSGIWVTANSTVENAALAVH
jgi:Flp pilus assembly pilin Flp